MDKSSVILVLLCCSIGVVHSKSTFLFDIPEAVVAGTNMTAHFNLIGIDPPATYDLKLLVHKRIMSQMSGSMPIDRKVSVTMKIPETTPTTAILNLTVHTAQFPNYLVTEQKNINIIDSRIDVFIHTDKNSYEPGEKVHIKILVQRNGKRAQVMFPNVWISNPRMHNVMKWSNAFTPGIRTLHYYLRSTASLGSWMVRVQVYPNLHITKSTMFQVRKIIKPNFHVIITPPPYVLADQTDTNWTICVRRKDGSAPRGNLLLTLRTDTSIRDSKVTEHATLPSPKGCYNFVHKGAIANIGTWHKFPEYVILMANFTEDGTNATEGAICRTRIYNEAVKLKFRENSDKYFKLGLPYFGTLEVKFPDGVAAGNQNIQLCLTPHRGNRNIPDAKECNDFVSGPDGCIHFLVPPQPQDTIRLVTTACATDYSNKTREVDNMHVPIMTRPTAKNELYLVYTRSGNYLLVSQGDQRVVCNEVSSFIVLYTLNDVYSNGTEFVYNIYHDADLVLEDSLIHFPTKDSVFKYSEYPNILGTTRRAHFDDDQTIHSFKLNITITPKMATTSEIEVSTTQKGSERVSHSSTFYVGPCLPNTVKTMFIAADRTPGAFVKYEVRADPGSLCDISFIEKPQAGIPLLQPNVIDVNQVYEEIEAKHTTFGGETVIKPDCDKRKKGTPKNMTDDSEIIWPWQKVNRRRRSFEEAHDESCGRIESTPADYAVKATARTSEVEYLSGDYDPDTTLKLFQPKVWLSETLEVGDNGVATLERQLPNSVTDWNGYTVCTSPNGLGVASPANISAFRSFVLNYDLPHSVKLGEVMIVKVVLFNLETHNIPAKIELEMIPEIEVVGSQLSKSFCVEPQGSAVLEYALKPLTSGTVNITITGAIDQQYPTSCNTSEFKFVRDDVVTPLIIVPEGVPVVKTRTTLICPDGQYCEPSISWDVTLPEDRVPNSESAYVNVVPDLVGLTSENMNKLLPGPKDCAEQNMLLLVSNLLALKYMDAFSMNNSKIHQQATMNLEDGYQRQFGFKLVDGSYAPFIDSVSSIWLSAYVMKWLAKSDKYTLVTEDDLRATRNWIVNKQLDNGCFPVIGSVVRKEMKSDLQRDNSTVALTAYILISLLESGAPVPNHVINKAVSCLENKMAHLDGNLYAKILTTYAFALHKHGKVHDLMKTLMGVATVESSDVQWWTNKNDPSWPLSVEMTCYMVLTFIKLGGEKNLNDAFKSIHWILKQRNADGGFVTTQDTAVCLQALTEYAIVLNNRHINLTIYENAREVDKVLSLHDADRMTLSHVQLPLLPTSIEVSVSDRGCALIQLETRYSVTSISSRPDIFDLSVNIHPIDDSKECKTLNINISTGYKLPDRESNMALLEFGLLSGYVADFDSLELLLHSPSKGVKHVEVNNDVVHIYFDKLTNKQICVSFDIIKKIVVKNLKPTNLKIYDYYEPIHIASSTYRLPSTCSNSYSNSSA